MLRSYCGREQVLKWAKPDKIGGLKFSYSYHFSHQSTASSCALIQSSEDGAFITGKLAEDEDKETLLKVRQAKTTVKGEDLAPKVSAFLNPVVGVDLTVAADGDQVEEGLCCWGWRERAWEVSMEAKLDQQRPPIYW